MPTPCYNDAYSVGTPKWAFWGKGWQRYHESTFSSLFGRFFLVCKRTFYFSGGLYVGCYILGGPGILGLALAMLSLVSYPLNLLILVAGLLLVIWCWIPVLSFLAVAEHRLIPSRARSIGHQLRIAGHPSIWAPACQDKIAGGHAGVGVVSLGGAPLSLPFFITPQFQEFFRLGRVLRTTLPTAQEGVVHLFVVYGYQGAEEDAEKLRLTDRLLQAVLAEAQVVCVGQPMLIAGDLNADPAVIPCLAKGMSAGRYVDLALAHSLGAGLAPDNTCTFNRDDGSGSRRDFFIGCPGALAASHACYVTDRWFTPHFSLLARFRIGAWMADIACPIACQPLWPACWLDTPDRSSSSTSRIVQDVWDIYRDVLGTVPDHVVLALKDAASRSAIDDLWSIWSQNAEAGHLDLTLLLEVLLLLVALPILVEVCYEFVTGVWEVELLVAGVLAGCIVLVKGDEVDVHCLSTLFILLFLLCYSFVDVLSQ